MTKIDHPQGETTMRTFTATIEAMQYDGTAESYHALLRAVGAGGSRYYSGNRIQVVVDPRVSDIMEIGIDDWIVRLPGGTLHALPADLFAALFGATVARIGGKGGEGGEA